MTQERSKKSIRGFPATRAGAETLRALCNCGIVDFIDWTHCDGSRLLQLCQTAELIIAL